MKLIQYKDPICKHRIIYELRFTFPFIFRRYVPAVICAEKTIGLVDAQICGCGNSHQPHYKQTYKLPNAD